MHSNNVNSGLFLFVETVCSVCVTYCLYYKTVWVEYVHRGMEMFVPCGEHTGGQLISRFWYSRSSLNLINHLIGIIISPPVLSLAVHTVAVHEEKRLILNCSQFDCALNYCAKWKQRWKKCSGPLATLKYRITLISSSP